MKFIELKSTCVRCYYSIQVAGRSYSSVIARLAGARNEFPSTASVRCDIDDNNGHWVLYADRSHTNESLAAYGSSALAEYEQANGEWSK